MKFALPVIALFSTVLSAQAVEYKCILESKVYKKSPVATIESHKDAAGLTTWTIDIVEAPNSYTRLFKGDVKDKTDDVYAQYVNRTDGVKVGFYLDESDAMGLMEGAIESPVMNGAIRCNYAE